MADPIAQTPLQIAEAQSPSQYNSTSNPGGTINAPIRTAIPAITPTPPPTQSNSTTTASNVNKVNATPGIIAQNQNLTNVGLSTDVNGNTVHANGDIYNPLAAGGHMDYSGNINGTYLPNTPTPSNLPAGSYLDYSGNVSAIPPNSNIPQGVNIVGTTGNGSYIGSDGRQYAPPTGDTSYIDQQISQNNASIKAASDSAMADAINTIQKNYDNYIQQQQQVNAGQQAGVQNALLMGGVTGQGSQAQYAYITADSNLNSTINYGQQQIIKLQNDRDSLIAQAKTADYSNAADVKSLSDLNAELQKNKDAQLAEAQKLSDAITTQTQKIADAKLQSSKDTTIADQILKGVTDPNQILSSLEKNGNNLGITAADIANVLKIQQDQATATLKALSDAEALKVSESTIAKNNADTAKVYNDMKNAGVNPVDVQSLQSTLGNFQGTPYVTAADLTGYTPAEKAAIIVSLKAQGIKTLDPNSAKAIDSINAAQSDLQSISSAINDPNFLPKSWTGQPLQYINVKFNQILQTNPALAAYPSWSAAVLPILSGLKGASSGGGGGSARLIGYGQSLLPKPTDTLPVAQKKLDTIYGLLNNGGNAILGKGSNPTQLPNSGDEQLYNGATYKYDGTQWVKQ